MNKPNQTEFKRVEQFEKQFKKRYNRDVTVYKALTLGEDNSINKVTVHIVLSRDEKYTITEYLTKDNTTDYVLSGKLIKDDEEGEHKYKRYLDAEVFIADLIGEKHYGDVK